MITINKMYRVIFIKNIPIIQNSALNSFKQTQKFSMALTPGMQDQNLHLWSLLYLQHLGKYLVHSQYSMNIY